MKIGVLGLQGDVREHGRALEEVGATPVPVKHPDDLAMVDGLVLPGGESTTIGKLLDHFDLMEPLQDRVDAGMPLYGTCAGMILMASAVTGGEAHGLGILDATVHRNAYGRQIDSFETDLEVKGFDEPYRAVFIRAPRVETVGSDVDVLAELDGNPVLVRQGKLLASSFHPEMTEDRRVHELFLDMAGG
jgi:pyridoxal 5'-phosphate synthase pdxT subunit